MSVPNIRKICGVMVFGGMLKFNVLSMLLGGGTSSTLQNVTMKLCSISSEKFAMN
jgi:hypothetical protein